MPRRFSVPLLWLKQGAFEMSITVDELVEAATVIPVLTVARLEDAVPLALCHSVPMPLSTISGL